MMSRLEKQARSRDETIRKMAGKPGLRGKIEAKCYECIYDPYQEGTWRKQIENCTSKACPLYSVRPLTLAGQKEVINDV